MSGNDSSSKTEKPTPRRMEQARENGQVAKSQDLNSAVVLGAATLVLMFVGPSTYNTFYSTLRYTFSHLSTKTMTTTSFGQLLADTTISVIWLLMPILILICAMATLGNLLQVKPLFTLKPLQPKLEKINPVSGFKRLWAMRSIVEVVKSLIKMAIIGGGGYLIISAHMDQLMITMMTDITTGWGLVARVAGLIALWSVSFFFVLGIADFLYQKYELEKQLRMSRQEIKDERKNQEGDPMIKSKIRHMGIQMSRNRQLAEVPTADVVITNPTHFAVAIKYDPDLAPAPVVVAKGADHFAFKIRELAKENGVMIVENKPLARSLYKIAEVEAMIPAELFVAVAETLAYVFAKNKGRKNKNKHIPGGKKHVLNTSTQNPRPAN